MIKFSGGIKKGVIFLTWGARLLMLLTFLMSFALIKEIIYAIMICREEEYA